MKDRRTKIIRQIILAGAVVYLFPPYSSAAPVTSNMWTLQRSISRAISIAPELKIAQATVRSHRGDVERAGVWPNPSFGIRIQNDITQQKGQNGYTLDQFNLTQPLPLWRLRYQRRVAQQGMRAAQIGSIQVRYNIEASTAKLFLALQVSHAKLRVAIQQTAFTHKLIDLLQGPAKASGIVRYVSQLEGSRLQLLNETAEQNADTARNNYQESLHMFRDFLLLPPDETIRLPSIQPIATLKPLRRLLQQLNADAVSLRQLRHQVQAGKAGVDLQRVRRFRDPVLMLIREKNVASNNQVFTFNGIMLSVSLPLWNQNHGNIEKAQAQVARTKAQIEAARRNLTLRLRQDYMRMQHLLAQSHHIEQDILPSAKQVLNNTKRNYAVGAVDTLVMIDAYNTYFNARTHYLDLLFRGRQQSIDLSQMLGQSALFNDDVKRSLP
ncbi:MAG: TolC family protein [Gammaproteobacteria bacterium]|nr:MAG: TolC family protein [Gammaproteobacteria bacterium]